MEINKENIRKAINVMQRVADNEETLKRQLFYLPYYQTYNGEWDGHDLYKTEDEAINHCGTTCCFVGWLAISPEFRELGVNTNFYGAPVDADGNTNIIRELLGMSYNQYESFIYGLTYHGENFYDKEIETITPHDIIKKLEELL